jgi:hypothetical protein
MLKGNVDNNLAKGKKVKILYCSPLAVFEEESGADSH